MLKAEPMGQRHPPTPPNVPAEWPYDLQQLVQHNANTQYKYEVDDSPYAHSGGPSTYGSPAPVMQQQQHPGDPYMSPQYGVSSYPDPHGHDVGLGISMEGYGAPGPTYYHDEGQVYHNLPYMHQGMQANTPPTPKSATASDGGRRTRSGTSAARTVSPASKPRASKPKKKSGSENKNKPKTPKLTAPLSELTKDFNNIPVRNMEEWVNRSAEVRKEEAAKRNGYITRPMNSFMLYRSAFAERTKIWCLQNNHQVVSSVSGESWPMEPPEVREHYNELAKIERINHQNAHPDYKFSPSKTTPAARKRKGTYSDEDDSEPSELDDPDADWAPNRRSRTKSNRRQPVFDERSFGPNNGVNKSTWEATNEGRPAPVALGSADLQHQYYQTTVHPHGANPGIEDVRMHRMEHPGVRQQTPMYPVSQPLLGLPGGQQAHELLQLGFPSGAGTPGIGEPQVDPMLLGFNGEHPFGQDDRMQEQQFSGAFDEGGYPAFMSEQPPEHPPADWQVDASLMPMEPASEFDKWMDETVPPS